MSCWIKEKGTQPIWITFVICALLWSGSSIVNKYIKKWFWKSWFFIGCQLLVNHQLTIMVRSWQLLMKNQVFENLFCFLGRPYIGPKLGWQSLAAAWSFQAKTNGGSMVVANSFAKKKWSVAKNGPLLNHKYWQLPIG